MSGAVLKTCVAVAAIVCKPLPFNALMTNFTHTFKCCIKHLAWCNYSTLNGLYTHLWLIQSSIRLSNDYCLPLDYTWTFLWAQAKRARWLLWNGSAPALTKPGLLSNKCVVVNSSLLHSSWQNTVMEDKLFTSQDVIARLDFSALPRKYQMLDSELTGGEMSHRWRHLCWAHHQRRAVVLPAQPWEGRTGLLVVNLQERVRRAGLVEEGGCLCPIDSFYPLWLWSHRRQRSCCLFFWDELHDLSPTLSFLAQAFQVDCFWFVWVNPFIYPWD